MSRNTLVFTVAFSLMGGIATWSQTLSVSDGNASITVDPHTITGPVGLPPGGMINWTTDGINQLYEQSWYHRIGNATRESHLAALPLIHEEILSTNQIQLTYSGSGLHVDVLYTLTGGPAGSRTSTIAEAVTLTNLSVANTLSLAWFEYDDIDIVPVFRNIAAGGVDGVTQQNQRGTSEVTVTPLSPTPDRFEINQAAPVQTLRNALQDPFITDLSNAMSPFGPTDIDFAFQWNLNIPVNGSVTISKTMVAGIPVPEPSAMVLVGLGILGALVARFRR